MPKTYGLIGRSLSHSFSKTYFANKFKMENIDAEYRNFELVNISEFKHLIHNNRLDGLNVTIPYKKEILPFLDIKSHAVEAIGACNVVAIEGDNIVGYNTDYLGFSKSLLNTIQSPISNALVLGIGGASSAIQYALKQLNISFKLVSRREVDMHLTYDDLNSVPKLMDVDLIVNTTPLGMYPNENDCPALPYDLLNPDCLLFDLIYNPEETIFLAKGRERGLKTKNGLEMLEIQAEESYKIWTAI